jgi:hypothetical protein
MRSNVLFASPWLSAGAYPLRGRTLVLFWSPPLDRVILSFFLP